jgi:hypothetical protein
MQKFYLIIFSLALFGCSHSRSVKAQRLADTLAALKKELGFRPLSTLEAYDFINKYYLPRLDTMPTKRKIFIYPLESIDFNHAYKYNEKVVEKEDSENMLSKSQNGLIMPPPPPTEPPGRFDKNIKWDALRLFNTKIIADTAILMDDAKILRDLKAWHRVYGFGYMCISYPQYNPYTNRLFLNEYFENDDWCGTGHDRKLWYIKVPNGWEASHQ